MIMVEIIFVGMSLGLSHHLYICSQLQKHFISTLFIFECQNDSYICKFLNEKFKLQSPFIFKFFSSTVYVRSQLSADWGAQRLFIAQHLTLSQPFYLNLIFPSVKPAKKVYDKGHKQLAAQQSEASLNETDTGKY